MDSANLFHFEKLFFFGQSSPIRRCLSSYTLSNYCPPVSGRRTHDGNKQFLDACNGHLMSILESHSLDECTDHTLPAICDRLEQISFSIKASSNHDVQFSPLQSWMIYICPTIQLINGFTLIIADERNSTFYGVPHRNTISSLIEPSRSVPPNVDDPLNRVRNAVKEARLIMKIRRKKMKKHKRRKLMKRMLFVFRKIRHNRLKKKEAAFQQKLGSIRESGENFDALLWVKEELDKARRGGFFIDVLNAKSSVH